MGSGERFEVFRSDGVGFGFYVSRFPFSLTINLNLLLWVVSIGFGKGYDQ